MLSIFNRKEPISPLTETVFDKVKFKARIAFIDDQEVAHIERLRKDGYNIHSFPDIETIDDFLRKEYHVIILDIQGVGTSLSPNQGGWGLLKYLKDHHPHIVVIMFTGNDWSITQYNEIAKRADDFIGKDLEFLDFKAKLDNGIRKAFSVDYHFDIEKAKIATGIGKANSIAEIKKIIENYGSNESRAMKKLKKHIKDPEILKSFSSMLTLLNSARKLFTGI